MSEPHGEEPLVPPIDKVVHEPVRMAILAVLDGVEDADFLFLRSLLGLSTGNLSSHLTRLEEAGYVEVIKSFRGRRPNTAVAITADGKAARETHWAALEALHRPHVPTTYMKPSKVAAKDSTTPDTYDEPQPRHRPE